MLAGKEIQYQITIPKKMTEKEIKEKLDSTMKEIVEKAQKEDGVPAEDILVWVDEEEDAHILTIAY